MGLKLKNDAVSRLASNVSSLDTSILLTPGSGVLFPVLSSGDYFPATMIKIDGSHEIIKVTARSTDTLTVVRSQEGTAAQTFSANDKIELRLTAGIVETINTLVDAALPRSGGTMTGDLVLAGDPTENLEAATKAYVDAKDASRKTYVDTADATLTNAISSEATARASADTELSGAISAEATARSNADSAEVTARNSAIASAIAAIPAVPVIGQSWQSFNDTQRAQGVTYTNDTGKTIQVFGTFGCNGGGQGFIYINGNLISRWSAQFNGCGGWSCNMGALIPPGATYMLANMGGGFNHWWELR